MFQNFLIFNNQILILETIKEDSSKLNNLNDNLSIKNEIDTITNNLTSNTPTNLNELSNDDLNNSNQANQQNLNSQQQTNSINQQLNNNLNNQDDLLKGVENPTTEFNNSNVLIKNEFSK